MSIRRGAPTQVMQRDANTGFLQGLARLSAVPVTIESRDAMLGGLRGFGALRPEEQDAVDLWKADNQAQAFVYAYGIPTSSAVMAIGAGLVAFGGKKGGISTLTAGALGLGATLLLKVLSNKQLAHYGVTTPPSLLANV